MPWKTRLRGRLLGALAALSLLLAAMVVWVWVGSFDREFHHASVLKADGRFTLRSKWGQFVWFGPPEGVEDFWGGELAKEMSNSDFEWQSLRPGYVEGIGKPQSPTWRMYGQYRQWLTAGNLQAAPQRSWLAGMEDQSRFLASHFMLLHMAEDKRKSYFNYTYPWREGAFRTMPTYPPPQGALVAPEMRVDPVLYLKADASGSAPDLSLREKLRQEWHDVLDTPRWVVFHGWVVLGLMVLPLAWVARPRVNEATRTRWVFNGIALVSAVICIASSTMWVRSYWVDEQWKFAQHPSSTIEAKWNYPMATQSWVGSSKGVLIWRASDTPETRWIGVRPIGWGYENQITPGPTLPGNISVPLSGERKFKMPGMDFHAVPPQVISMSIPAQTISMPGIRPGAGMVIPASSTTILLGFRSLLLWWWMIVLVSAVAPLIWGWRAGVRWSRIRKSKRLAERICLECGYDMRATPGRCPECGHVPTEAAGEAPVPQ